ncbi:predicted protein [Postia placenta Mad-698-R]|nr:predicted protein [Postia placenta Mad-698-R]
MQPTREFVEFEVDDKENPRRWNTWFKGFIVVWICFNAFTITCYASTYLDAVPYVQELFHVGSTVAKLGFTFYAGACGIGPLFLAPLCELYGRKWVYVGSALGWTALLWFGFTTYTSVPYMVPIVASGFYGFGFLAVSLSTFYYTIDAYTTYAASAFAAQAMIRSVATSVFVLFGTQMFSGLGPRWATFILAMIGVVEIALPIVFMRKGEALRKASGFASLEAEHVNASSDEEKQSVDDEKQVWVEGQTA